MGNFLSENNKNEKVENTVSEITDDKEASDMSKEILKIDAKDGSEITTNINSTGDNNISVTPRTLIQAPIVCPKGQRPDRYGNCRAVF